MKRVFAGLLAALGLSMIGSLAAAAGPYAPGKIGLDVSWPNCGVPLPKVDFGIVGVTGGTVYSKNNCLAGEAKVFGPNLSLYVNTGWNEKSPHINPTSPRQCAEGDRICLAYNYGFNAGIQAVDVANAANVHSDKWWLDVETLNTWNAGIFQNRSSVQGTYDALKSRGIPTIGVYSTAYQWNKIVGDFRPGWPTWVATGTGNLAQAKRFCFGNQFTGGPTWLVQYIPPRPNLDHNLAC